MKKKKNLDRKKKKKNGIGSTIRIGREIQCLPTLLNWDQTESVPGLADLDQPGQGSLPEGRLLLHMQSVEQLPYVGLTEFCLEYLYTI